MACVCVYVRVCVCVCRKRSTRAPLNETTKDLFTAAAKATTSRGGVQPAPSAFGFLSRGRRSTQELGWPKPEVGALDASAPPGAVWTSTVPPQGGTTSRPARRPRTAFLPTRARDSQSREPPQQRGTRSRPDAASLAAQATGRAAKSPTEAPKASEEKGDDAPHEQAPSETGELAKELEDRDSELNEKVDKLAEARRASGRGRQPASGVPQELAMRQHRCEASRCQSEPPDFFKRQTCLERSDSKSRGVADSPGPSLADRAPLRTGSVWLHTTDFVGMSNDPTEPLFLPPAIPDRPPLRFGRGGVQRNSTTTVLNMMTFPDMLGVLNMMMFPDMLASSSGSNSSGRGRVFIQSFYMYVCICTYVYIHIHTTGPAVMLAAQDFSPSAPPAHGSCSAPP